MDEERRYEFHDELVALVGSEIPVYFQPPASIKLTYPCIVYNKASAKLSRANNRLYSSRQKYALTVITKDPDDELPLTVIEHFPYSSVDRFFITDNLYHNVIGIYY